jgi:hypothetical protein
MAMLHWAQPTVALRPAQLRFSCSIWPFSPRARAGESAGFRRAAMADQISAAADDEVQWGGFVEQAGRVANQIWGGGEEGGHRRGLLVAGEECWHDRVEVTDGVGMVGEELLGGTKLGVGARGSKNDQRRLALARSSWCSGGGGR